MSTTMLGISRIHENYANIFPKGTIEMINERQI